MPANGLDVCAKAAPAASEHPTMAIAARFMIDPDDNIAPPMLTGRHRKPEMNRGPLGNGKERRRFPAGRRIRGELHDMIEGTDR
jgi:hypothetical protein